MRQIFLNKITDLGVSKDTKILVAVSGGVDSMVLLDLLFYHGFNFEIAHCNFCLRGKESDLDEDFVVSIANKMKKKIFIKKFNTVSYAENKKLSIQMAARELRYDWFSKITSSKKQCIVLVAHHLDDSIETVILNLIRGTGISGLHGIKHRNNNVIRPLIEISKKDILEYASVNNISFRDDSSNQEDKYVRNNIRKNIIPLMNKINPKFTTSFGRTIKNIQDVEGLYVELLSQKKTELMVYSNGEYRVSISNLLKYSFSKQLLYEIISDFNFNDLESVYECLRLNSGKEFFNSKFYMIKDRDHLIITKHIENNSVFIHQVTKEIETPCLSFSVSSNLDNQYSHPSKSAIKTAICFNKLEFPLMLRPWHEGDSFIPLGMKSFKKVSDYFIDKKLSLIDKRKAKILTSNNKIVCIITEKHHRLDDRFKLVQDSKKIYIVTSKSIL